MIFNSILQILSIVSFGPLVLVLTKNEKIRKYQELYFNDFNDNSFLILVIFSCIFFFILSNITNILVSKLSLTLGQKIGIKFVENMFSLMINKDYSFHVNTSSAEIITKITLESGRVINGIITPILLFNSRAFTVIFIFVGLLTINIKISLLVLTFFIINYLIIFSINKKILEKKSYLISKNSRVRQKIVSETFANMRETILFDTKKFFLDLFNKSNKEIATSIASIQFISVIPRYIIEILGFLLIMIAILFLVLANTLVSFLPIVSIYLVSGYKLLPALQNIASSYASIKGSYSSLEGMMPDLEEIEEMAPDLKNIINNKDIVFNTLFFEKINFSYSHDKTIFKDANFNISRNQIVGLIGKTGIGKSTFIDILCGLIPPQDTKIFLNNKNTDYEKYKDIKNLIAIVPQKINLLDDTIKNNIFFSREKTDNSNNELEYLKKTCLLDYVDDNYKWDTIIGENGSKLSGGQIQRLGIARALYRKPQILILDEATAGLDSISEKEIIKNLINFKPKMTILIISHNKEILNVCDSIYEIKNQKFEKIK
ncbi:ABC transporter ATP-binding protein/permease [Candidatus Pelagibacter sp.]|nr:ABC transporter ATP-binding protein/permease [Candidatus Pelagibacter sp.]